MNPFDCIVAVADFAPAVKLSFYLHYAHALTISGRIIWSEEDLPVAERLDRMKWLNEAMHQVLNRALDVQQGDVLSEIHCYEAILGVIQNNPAISGDVGGALLSAYRATIQQIEDAASGG